MNEYIHFVSGFFATHTESEDVLSRLVEQGFPRERIRIFKNDPATPEAVAEATSNIVLKNVLIDGAVGAAVGGGIGVAAEAALVAANVSLFVASPLIAPLVMLGWGVGLGGFIGAAAAVSTGGEAKKQEFAELVRDAVSSGQVVLLVETRTEREAALARDLIREGVGGDKDVKAA